MWECNGFAAQSMVTGANGSIRVAGKCLDIYDWGRGTKVHLYACHGGNNQQWQLRSDGTVVNPPTNRCLTSTSGEIDADVEVQDCTAKPTQI